MPWEPALVGPETGLKPSVELLVGGVNRLPTGVKVVEVGWLEPKPW